MVRHQTLRVPRVTLKDLYDPSYFSSFRSLLLQVDQIYPFGEESFKCQHLNMKLWDYIIVLGPWYEQKNIFWGETAQRASTVKNCLVSKASQLPLLLLNNFLTTRPDAHSNFDNFQGISRPANWRKATHRSLSALTHLNKISTHWKLYSEYSCHIVGHSMNPKINDNKSYNVNQIYPLLTLIYSLL